MAKKLYTASSPEFNTNVSINNTENIIAPECIIQVDTPESKNVITQRVFDIANKYLQNFVSSRNTAESCADGSCPTVYIPVIIQHYNYVLDDDYNLYGTGYQHSTLQDETNPYVPIKTAFQKVNDYFQNTAEETVYSLSVQTNSQSLNSENIKFTSLGQKHIRHYTDPSKLGYYTGAKIFDEETNTFIDEYVPHYSVRELHPNVKFFFPKRLRKEYLATLFPASSGCEVDANDLRNFMQDQITSQSYNLMGLYLSFDYFYFNQGTPGYVYWDMNAWNAEFFQKLNHIQKAIYSNTKPLNVPIQTIDPAWIAETDIDLYNLNGATIFNELGYNYSCSAYNPDNRHSSLQTSAYGTKTIKGNVWVFPETIIHEWGHAHGATHSWNSAKVLGGSNSRTVSRLRYDILGERLTIAGPNCEIKSVYNNEFKPPFIYEEPNDSYRKRLRDSQLADSEYQDLLDNAPLDRSASYSEKIEKYLERKDLLAQHLAETPETKVVDFFNLEDKEKEYVEYIYNDVVKEFTDNFTRKYVFTNGSSDGVTRARVNLNKWRFFSFGKSLMNSDLQQTAVSSLLGIQSFWGGSIVFNDADLMATVSAQEGVAGVETTPEVQKGDFIEGGIVFQIKEDSTGLVGALEDLGRMDWDDAMDAANSSTLQGYDDWYLPNIEELGLMRSTVGQGGTNIANFLSDNHWSSSIDGSTNSSPLTESNIPVRVMYFYYGTTSIIGKGSKSRVRVIRSITISEPTEAITATEGKTYEEDFLEKIIANPDASTSLVVNPEDNLFNRRGPNVTTRIPFCVQADGTPSEDLTLNTKFDPFWAHNLNAFNPAYPEYPANTKVEDLLNDEYCPCLRLTQTYYDGSETPYEYKIIGGTQEDLIALNRLYYYNYLRDYEAQYQSELTASISAGAFGGIVQRIGWPDEINIYEVTGSGSYETSTCRTCNSGTSEETGTLQDDKRFDSYALFWAHATSQLYESANVIKGSKYNQMVPLYKYSNGHVLNLPIFSGYSGVGGIHTAVPNVFKTRDKEIDEELVASGDKDATNIIYTKGQSVPNEYYLNDGYLALNTSLFLAAETDGGETVTASISPVNFINRVYSTNNARNRYGLGFTTPGEALYNPLKDLHYHETYVNQHQQNFNVTDEWNITTVTSKIEQYGTFSNEFEHYSDLYGEYNPLYIANVMGYQLTSIATKSSILPKEFVKKLNYHYNRADVPDNLVYASIYADQENATYDYENSYQGGGSGSHLAHSDSGSQISKYLNQYKSIVNSLDVDLVVLGCTDSSKFNYDPNATDNDGTCIDIVEGCIQSWANNYNPEANTDNGSCYAELCLDPAATGDFATGYDWNAISSAQAYADQYNLTDIITAAETDIVPNDAFDTSNNSLCQFLVVPKRALVRFVCNAPYNDIASCNQDPLISYIEDADTGAINAHTANPIRKQAYLSELLPAEGESKSAFNISILPTVYYIKNSGSKGGFPYLGASLDEDPSNSRYHPSNSETEYVFSYLKYDSRPATWTYSALWNRIRFSTDNYLGYRYNCVENPILPDGSGGCYLYNSNGELDNNSIPIADRLIGCSFPELESQTPFGCNNEIVFEGGVVIDVTFLQTYDVEANSSCTEDFNNFTRYALFGAPAVSIGGSHKYNMRGLVIESNQLPSYTESDLGSYDSSILNESQIPLRKRKSRSSRNEITNSDAVPEANPLTYSDPFNLESSIILYTEDGNSYTGKFKIAHNSETLERHYFAYDEVLKTITKQLYFRTDVLNKFNPLMTLTEREAKKFNKVTNKIINLTTFTTN